MIYMGTLTTLILTTLTSLMFERCSKRRRGEGEKGGMKRYEYASAVGVKECALRKRSTAVGGVKI